MESEQPRRRARAHLPGRPSAESSPWVTRGGRGPRVRPGCLFISQPRVGWSMCHNPGMWKTTAAGSPGCSGSCRRVWWGRVWPHGLGSSEDTRDLSGYSSIFPGELPTPGLLVSGQVLAGTTGSLGR